MKVHRTILASCMSVILLGLASPAIAQESPESPFSEEISGAQRSDGTVEVSTGDVGLVIEKAPAARMSEADMAARAATFTCSLDVQWPHGSTHVAGTINVVTVVQCQIPASNIRLATSLIRTSPSYAQWHAGTKNVTGASRLQNNAATSCNAGPGNFRGWGWGTITPPPGYQLEGPADYDKYGDIKPVACGVSRDIASNDGEVAERLTVTFVRSDLVADSSLQ